MQLLAIREEWTHQGSLGYSLEEVETGRFYDFAAGELADQPRRMVDKLTERWKTGGDEDENGDPALADLKPLRGCFANVNVEGGPAALDVSDLPRGLYKIYIADLEADGNVVRIYDWLNVDDSPNVPGGNQTGGTAVNVQVPEKLTFQGSLTVDVPGLGSFQVTPATPTPDNPAQDARAERTPAQAEKLTPAKPGPAPATPTRKPTAPTPSTARKGSRKST
jgi:hypothetical protein